MVDLSPDLPTVALFRDATETLFALAEGRRANEPDAPLVPQRHFVRDADEAHRIALEGPDPIVGMSLDDLLVCRRMSHPAASELVAFCAVHRGFLRLMSAPGLTRIADLRGRRIAVDTDTGYAAALFEILRREGLARGRDYEVVYAGATNVRFQKLVAGGFDATLLGTPFSRLAQARGFNALGRVVDALGGYQAIVLCGRRSWLDAHMAQADAVALCLTQTLAWARAAAHQGCRDALLRETLPGCPAPVLQAIADDLFGPDSDMVVGRYPDPKDIAVVTSLFNASRGTSLGASDVACAWR
ncbi:MAG: hypothetical protein AB1592_19075 [Pseudomonadota bacterium]